MNHIDVIIYIAIFIVGTAIGSFLNVVAYRLPKILFDQDYALISGFLIEESEKPKRFLSGVALIDNLLDRKDAAQLLYKNQVLPAKGLKYLSVPASSCPSCDHKIRFYENVPILGWLFLKGKCSNCREPISFQYPLVEFITGLLSVIVIYVCGVNWEGLSYLFFVWILISLSLIDLEFRILPDCLTVPVMWLGLILSYFEVIPVPFKLAFFGAIIGYLSLWVINQLSLLLLRKEGIGAGDFKLLALIGAWQGLGNLFNVILISSIAGTVIGIIVLACRKNNDKYIPYGPFLALGSLLVLLLGLNPDTFLYTL